MPELRGTMMRSADLAVCETGVRSLSLYGTFLYSDGICTSAVMPSSSV